MTVVGVSHRSARLGGVQAPRVKRVLRYVDHSAIYLLIAGTYTPFALVSLQGAWGWSVFGVIWVFDRRNGGHQPQVIGEPGTPAQ